MQELSSNLDKLSLIEKKKKLLNDMFIMTQEQANFIKEEKLEELESILDKKDFIINQINDIDLEIKKLILDKPEDDDVLTILSQIKNILNKMKILDDSNNKELSKAIADMNNGLKEVRIGMRAMQNYSNSDPYQSFATQGGTLFIDQES